MTDFTSSNAYTADHFPDDWDEDDYAFLAQFLADEYGSQFVRVLNDRDYDYELFREADDE